jgi:hypothetical protein
LVEMFDRTEGRMSRGWRLVDASWSYLRHRPRMLALPVLSAAAMTLAALIIFLPVLALTRDAPEKVSLFLATTAAALPFTFITTFFNVGFLSMVLADERGEEPTVRDGLRAAWRRLPAILGWTVLAAGVGVALDALDKLPGVDLAGRVFSVVGNLAWGLATFFVVPVLALEGAGPREAVRRSARTFRERWGESLTGDITIGTVFFVLMIPGLIVGGAGIIALDGHDDGLGILLTAIGAVLVLPLVVVSGALTELFTLALYRHTRDEVVAGPFTATQLESAVKDKPRRWWQ